MAQTIKQRSGSAYARLLREHSRQPDGLAVDRQVDKASQVVKLAARVAKLGRAIQARHPDPMSFVRYVDLRLQLQSLREERYFDLGFARGQLSGSVATARAEAQGRALAEAVGRLLLTSALPRQVALQALLDVARGLAATQVTRRPARKPRQVISRLGGARSRAQ
jgi:hypothetical protein